MKDKIFLFISTLSIGGAQRVVSNLSLGLSYYYDIYIVLHDGSKVGYPYKGNIIDLKAPALNNVIKKALNILTRVYRLKQYKSKMNPVATISFLESSNMINLLSGREGKKIVSVRNYKSKQAKGMYGRIFSVIIKKFYSKSESIVAASEGIKNDLVRSFGIKEKTIKVIYNPYNLEDICNAAVEPVADEFKDIFKYPIIITIGSLTRQKGQWHLIRAFKEVKKSIPGLNLVILGRGDLKKYLDSIVTEGKLENSVHFLGFQENPFKYIKKSTIFVFPSLFEGFPNALAEAMACGIPVISSDCKSGPREILAPDTNINRETEDVEFGEYGILTPVCDGNFYGLEESLTEEEKKLAKAIVQLLSNQDMMNHYKEKGMQRIMEFSLQNIIKQWLEVIEG